MNLNTTGQENTALGDSALFNNTADNNTAVGAQSLNDNTSGTRNVGVGMNAGYKNKTADDVTAIGFQAGYNSSVSFTAVGSNALLTNVTGTGNTAVGVTALTASTGSQNTAVGHNAGASITSGASNIILGAFADAGSTSASNQFVAGSSTAPVNNVYFGQGAMAAAPTPFTINGTQSSTNGTGGGDLKLAGGLANQAGDSGGSVVLQTATPGAGTTLSNKVVLTPSGILSLFMGADVASAGTITPTGNLFHVTGNTTITGISTAGINAGTEITIIFTGSVTINNGTSMKLAGGTFSATANSTLTLVFDGTTWFEKCRSVN
jgi:hypothetical protein